MLVVTIPSPYSYSIITIIIIIITLNSYSCSCGTTDARVQAAYKKWAALSSKDKEEYVRLQEDLDARQGQNQDQEPGLGFGADEFEIEDIEVRTFLSRADVARMR